MKNLTLFGRKISIEFVKFTIVGIVNTLIHLILLYFLVEYLSVYYVLASFIAFIFAVTNSFIMNTIWTFKENIKFKIGFRYIKFFIVSTLAAIVNLSLLYAITEFFGIWYILSQIIATSFSLVVNFLGNKIWTFNK